MATKKNRFKILICVIIICTFSSHSAYRVRLYFNTELGFGWMASRVLLVQIRSTTQSRYARLYIHFTYHTIYKCFERETLLHLFNSTIFIYMYIYFVWLNYRKNIARTYYARARNAYFTFHAHKTFCYGASQESHIIYYITKRRGAAFAHTANEHRPLPFSVGV